MYFGGRGRGRIAGKNLFKEANHLIGRLIHLPRDEIPLAVQDGNGWESALVVPAGYVRSLINIDADGNEA